MKEPINTHPNLETKTWQKRVGIITLTGSFNYGNRLQLYAITRVFSNLGLNPFSLEFRNKHSKILHPKELISARYIIPSNEEVMTEERRAAFKRFNKYIQTIHYDSIIQNLRREFDYFCVGSDQVWNPVFMGYYNENIIKRIYHLFVDSPAFLRNIKWYFLRFADRSQRIAYAPSIGLDSLDPFITMLFRRGIQGFDKLSIREYRGAEILNHRYHIHADVLVDPTLLITKNDWNKVADNRITPKEPYVLIYLLGSRDCCEKKLLFDVTDKGRLPILYLSDRQQPGEIDAGPAEFISLVAHAKHVITDSYHGSIFALIEDVPLTIVQRKGDAPNMYSRIETLSRQFDLSNKLFESPDFDLSKSGNYTTARSRLDAERKLAISFIKESVGITDIQIHN